MSVKLKPVRDQVIVITGADSGIGLATARLAAERGARLVLNSRNNEELARVSAEIRRGGAQVEWLAGDVADPGAMLNLAEVAIRAFGRIDTWVNNAGVSIYGLIEDVPVDDAHRMFETNYWGIVNGSLAALPYLKANGGTLINLGSIVSDAVAPLQGHYSASKHAVKGFTDALRAELLHQGAPVQVTLVKPSAIDTPYPEHAANYMDAEAQLPPPVYAPEVVARAILHCAAHPRRSVTVGGGGRMQAMMHMRAPAVSDVASQGMFQGQKRKTPGRLPQDTGLWSPPRRTGRVRGDQPGHVMKTSAYTAVSLHPVRAALAIAMAGVGYAIASGTGGDLLRRGRELLTNVRGTHDAMDDRDIEVEVRGARAEPPVAYAVVTEEVFVAPEPPTGDRYVP